MTTEHDEVDRDPRYANYDSDGNPIRGRALVQAAAKYLLLMRPYCDLWLDFETFPLRAKAHDAAPTLQLSKSSSAANQKKYGVREVWEWWYRAADVEAMSMIDIADLMHSQIVERIAYARQRMHEVTPERWRDVADTRALHGACPVVSCEGHLDLVGAPRLTFWHQIDRMFRYLQHVLVSPLTTFNMPGEKSKFRSMQDTPWGMPMRRSHLGAVRVVCKCHKCGSLVTMHGQVSMVEDITLSDFAQDLVSGLTSKGEFATKNGATLPVVSDLIAECYNARWSQFYGGHGAGFDGSWTTGLTRRSRDYIPGKGAAEIVDDSALTSYDRHEAHTQTYRQERKDYDRLRPAVVRDNYQVRQHVGDIPATRSYVDHCNMAIDPAEDTVEVDIERGLEPRPVIPKGDKR